MSIFSQLTGNDDNPETEKGLLARIPSHEVSEIIETVNNRENVIDLATRRLGNILERTYGHSTVSVPEAIMPEREPVSGEPASDIAVELTPDMHDSEARITQPDERNINVQFARRQVAAVFPQQQGVNDDVPKAA